MPQYSGDELLRDSPFTRLVGERLRRIRQQKQWSLSDVENRSDSEFKASVLGAYERGERAISVPRLMRLAEVYDVPADSLLPREVDVEIDLTEGEGTPAGFTIDLTQLNAIEDPEAKAVSTAERSMLQELDGSCRTPIGGFARLLPNGELHLTGLVAREDGSFLLKRALHGAKDDAERIGSELGRSLRMDSPSDIFA